VKSILAICIPVYNRLETLKYTLSSISVAIKGHEELVEIVIGDDCSKDDIYSFVKNYKFINPKINLVYYKNKYNMGGLNFFKVVEKCNSSYAWIIGSDDFIQTSSLGTILASLNENDPDILIGNVSNYKININELSSEEFNPYEAIRKSLTYNPNTFISKKTSEYLKNLISSNYPNVYLGTSMASIFKVSIWKSTVEAELDNFMTSNFKGFYPHVFIFAKGFMNTKAIYMNNEILVAGDGVRDWANETESTNNPLKKWDSYLPWIYIHLIRKFLNLYFSNGMNLKNYLISINDNALNVGDMMLTSTYLYWRFNISGKNLNQKIFIESIITNIFLPKFYLGIIKGLVRIIIKRY
jgi:hypothetical protein